MLEPRILLADTLAGVGAPGGSGGPAGTAPTFSEAIEQLREAISLAPDPTPIRLRIAEFQRRAGNMDAARAELDAIGAGKGLGSASRWAAVEALGAIGQFEDAAKMARDLIPTAGTAGRARACGRPRTHSQARRAGRGRAPRLYRPRCTGRRPHRGRRLRGRRRARLARARRRGTRPA